MRPSYYQEQWSLIRDSGQREAVESLCHRVAASFIDRYYYNDEYQREYIDLLCTMATYFEDQELNQLAASALFGIVIERLCDDFEELQTETYNRLICQVVNFLCRLPQGAELRAELKEFQLPDEQSLYQRIESMRINPDRPLPANLRPRKVIVLSRVTIGADVAITSVICQRLRHTYPASEIVVIGNEKLHQIMAAESGITVRELHYSRRGGLLERFRVWLVLLQEVRREIAGLSDSEFLVLDPDSRLTQLGVLPLVPEDNYRFFNSRGKQGYSAKATVAELANLWLDQILDEDSYCHPAVWLADDHAERAGNLRNMLDPDGSATLITINFGVGGNERKLVPGGFESELVCELLRDSGARVILDLGFGEEERQRSQAILAAARNQGFSAREAGFSELEGLTSDCRLLGVKCAIGEIAALIAAGDEFIGYDSACQHIAAAAGIRTFTIFAGTNNVRFIRRWHATGPSVSEIVYVDTISKHERIDNGEIIARIQDLRQPQ